MSCTELYSVLRSTAGEAPERIDEVMQHVATCADCTQYLTFLELVGEILSVFADQSHRLPEAPPPHLDETTLRELAFPKADEPAVNRLDAVRDFLSCRHCFQAVMALREGDRENRGEANGSFDEIWERHQTDCAEIQLRWTGAALICTQLHKLRQCPPPPADKRWRGTSRKTAPPQEIEGTFEGVALKIILTPHPPSFSIRITLQETPNEMIPSEVCIQRHSETFGMVGALYFSGIGPAGAVEFPPRKDSETFLEIHYRDKQIARMHVSIIDEDRESVLTTKGSQQES